MPEKNEPICFVPTGRRPERGDPYLDENGEFCVKAMDIHTECACRGLRRLPPGWTAEAVRRIEHLYADRCESGPPQAAILAALFPPPEPEPEPWMREAARTWPEANCRGYLDPEYANDLAKHIAKHAGGAK